MSSGFSKTHVEHVSRVLRTAQNAPTLPVPNAILDSWRRSVQHYKLDPGSLQGPRVLEAHQINEHRQRVDDFLHLAGDEMSRLHSRVRDADYCVMLTDTLGCTVDYRIDSALRGEYRRSGMDVGTCWSEKEEGTTAVSAVLIDKLPVTVHKLDHFRAAFIGNTCSAAPIFSPGGEILAVLDVSSVRAPDDRRSQHLIRQMVIQSATELENAYFMYSTQDLWVLRAHPLPGYVDSQPQCLFAWDRDGRIEALNPAARRLLLQRCGRIPAHIDEAFTSTKLPDSGDDSIHFLQSMGLHVRLKAPRRPISAPQANNPASALDPKVAQAMELAVRVKDRGLPVLIHGETGAGKEFFALQLHAASKRRDKPFVAVNCAAIPESLIESELFGYAAGAFTGASTKGMRGLLQQADGGTLFLDEIGDMPLALQTRLLRVLEDRMVVPIGGEPQAVNVRIISATHRDLLARVASGAFREDLYYRLNGLEVTLPALRERSDKPQLLDFLLAQEAQGQAVVLEADARQALLEFSWPGNVRQLRTVLRTLAALCEGGRVGLIDLPAMIRHAFHQAPISLQRGKQPLEDAERLALLATLEQQRWHMTLAAEQLGVSRNTLYRKLRKHGIALRSAG